MDDLTTDLENKLASSEGELLRQALHDQLASAELRLHKLVSEGVTPAAYAQAAACLLALATANDVLATITIEPPANAGAHLSMLSHLTH